MPAKEEIRKLRKLSQQFAYTSIKMHEAIGRKAGMSGTDHKYLGFLLQQGQMTAGEFSNITGLTTGAVTSLIDRFEKQKLVKRQADKADRRKVIIVPDTEKITALFKPLYGDFQSNTEKLFGTFSSGELKVLEKYFSEAMEIMDRKIQTINQKQ
ncbi:DNA-binding transcriptional regulator, MarR family [Chitinophaga ginsengisegetis]|uniref:DNA-binding transcriptional regulator, MarR family n=1 Tax=Chitinophaga ginsengisegetis TaxID=393003 RepID=A0A1T5PC06_9BACT|nr:helix-turn-helix domain-containing protein [Chitinophaga ginsengisegetis]SKD09918.1 DNA-binding transcriptional regulator, MarR family [Chitinophaga ginsengisegetis]